MCAWVSEYLVHRGERLLCFSVCKDLQRISVSGTSVRQRRRQVRARASEVQRKTETSHSRRKQKTKATEGRERERRDSGDRVKRREEKTKTRKKLTGQRLKKALRRKDEEVTRRNEREEWSPETAEKSDKGETEREADAFLRRERKSTCLGAKKTRRGVSLLQRVEPRPQHRGAAEREAAPLGRQSP
uniref:Uncharacterized protein n=1 Tax=Toxoplasma gondii COUG TaxID=1074873 RepID=A0A2G8YBI7_TOXGO|nr:hypothetical protein TGCOUG_250080 [Toxoplasma gondii COUG]